MRIKECNPFSGFENSVQGAQERFVGAAGDSLFWMGYGQYQQLEKRITGTFLEKKDGIQGKV